MLAIVLLLVVGPGAVRGNAQDSRGALPVRQADLSGFEPSIRQRLVEAEQRAAALRTAEAIGAFGILLHAYERFDLASACYAEARRLAPAAFDWAYFHGVALAQRGETEAAVRAFHDALALKPADVAARLRLGDLFFDLGRFDESAAQYRGVLTARPASALAAYGLGRVLRAQNEKSAVSYLERAVARAPSFGPALYALAQVYEAAGDGRAAALFQRYREARRVSAPLEEDPLERVAAARSGPFEDLSRGQELLRSGRHGEAVKVLERAAAASPGLVQVHVNLVAAYAASGAPDQAEVAYRRAAALSSQLPELHYNLGVLRLSQQRTSEAIEAFRTALAGNPSYADAHNNLAYLLAQQGKADEAIGHLRAALDASPSHRDAHFNLARLLLAAAEGDEALRHFASATEREDDKTPLYLYYLADACGRLGRPLDAERHAVAARTRAEALGQTSLVERIDADLRRLRAAMAVRR